MTMTAVVVDVLVHLSCAALMYFVARARVISTPLIWAIVGLFTGLIGLVVFAGVLGWQVMFQKGRESRALSRSEQMLKGREDDQLLAREAMQDPDRDWQLDQLIYEGKRSEALETARERLRLAHEMGNEAQEKLLRRYLTELSSPE